MNNKIFDFLQQLFTNNGYQNNGLTIKLQNPTTFLIKAEESNISIVFENNSFPLITFKKKINKYFSPSLSRQLIGITFSPNDVTFLIKNFPDLTLQYEEIGV